MNIMMDKTCRITEDDRRYIASKGIVYYFVPWDTAKPLIDAGAAHEATLTEMEEQTRHAQASLM